MSAASATRQDPPAPRRIVLALAFAKDEVLESIGSEAAPESPVAWTDPKGLRSLPLRFVSAVGPWGTAAAIGTGVGPPMHGVLTMRALDEASLAPRPRRAGDADRPWIWERWVEAGRGAVVSGWPGIADAGGSRVPLATRGMIQRPARFLAWARGSAWSVEDAAPFEGDPATPPQVIDPLVAALDAARSAEPPGEDPSARARFATGLVLAIARALEDAVPAGAPPRLAVVGGFVLEDDPGSIRAMLEAIRDDAGADGAVLVAVVGERSGRAWFGGFETRHSAVAAIDLVPTILELADLPVPADLAGRSLLDRPRATSRPWAIAARAGEGGAGAPPRPAAGVLARRALPKAVAAGEDPQAAGLRELLLHHFEAEWAVAFEQARWIDARAAADALVALGSRELDLWRAAFVAERTDDRAALAAAAARLRAEHPESTSTRLLALLEKSPSPRESPSSRESRQLVESIDLESLRLPTQRSVLGRAAAQLGLAEVARLALAPLVVSGHAIPADRMALASVLIGLGEGRRAVAALGALGLDPDGQDGFMLRLRASALAAADRRPEAIALLDRRLERMPVDGEARLLRESIRQGR